MAAIDPQSGKRCSADVAYEALASKRPNVTIITDATVLKILLESSTTGDAVAKRVEVSTSGETQSIAAEKEVLLCASGFNTPKLLELSGISSTELLNSLGIPLVVENRSVGANMQSHVMCLLTLELNEDVKAGEGIQSLAFLPLQDRAKQKELFQSMLSAGAHEEERANEQDFQKVVRSIFEDPNEASCCVFLSFIGLPSRASLGLMQSIPFSRGNSHITSADPGQEPRIDPRFFSHDLDLEILARPLLALEKVGSSSALGRYFKQGGQRLPKSDPIIDLKAAKSYLRDCAVTTYHSCGTAAMLSNDKERVVDQELRVFGTQTLRVVDISTFPVIPKANPMGTVYAVTEKVADLIRGVVYSLWARI